MGIGGYGQHRDVGHVAVLKAISRPPDSDSAFLCERTDSASPLAGIRREATFGVPVRIPIDVAQDESGLRMLIRHVQAELA